MSSTLSHGYARKPSASFTDKGHAIRGRPSTCELRAPHVLMCTLRLRCAYQVVEGLVEMMRSTGGDEVGSVIAALKLVTYGGAALAPHCDAILRKHGVTIACTYGQTELAGPVMFGKPGGDPNFLRPAGSMMYDVIPLEGGEEGTGELVLLGCTSATSGYLSLEPGKVARSLTGGDDDVVPQQCYHTNDRFRRVRVDDEEWLEYVCRNDDLLVHTSGEMSNPLPWEQQIIAECSAIVTAVCVVGTGMPRCMALVELSDGVSTEVRLMPSDLTPCFLHQAVAQDSAHACSRQLATHMHSPPVPALHDQLDHWTHLIGLLL